MQLRMTTFTALSALIFMQGCKVSTQLPVKSKDVRICDKPDTVIAAVKRISSDQQLSFHYGTHPTDYGTQATFRLIGRGYEIVLFNSMSQPDYTLRVYKVPPGDGGEQEAEQAFDQFSEMLAQATSDNCELPPGSGTAKSYNEMYGEFGGHNNE